MTKAEILSSDKEMLSCKDVAKIMGIDAQRLRCLARNGKLNFETIVYGTRVNIVKNSFIKYMGWTS